MRAHGIGDEGCRLDDEDPRNNWDKHGDSIPPGNKHMYALRANPHRLKSCRACENCGKEFLSWKCFLEHGKCTLKNVEFPISSHGSEDEDVISQRGPGWSKRKRSLRIEIDNENSNSHSSDEEDLANCLMMLSNARFYPSMAEPEESCASASKDEEQRKPVNFVSHFSYQVPSNNNLDEKHKGVARGLFECKACKKVFNSHQALGGHRASHKRVKGCFAARLDAVDDYVTDDDVITREEFLPTKPASNQPFDHGPNSLVTTTSKRKSKVHECSICHRVFSSGQALGGHKRCHWITSNSPDMSSLTKLQQFPYQFEQIHQNSKFIDADPLALKFDLNLPATSNELAGTQRDKENPKAVGLGLSTEIYLQSWLGLNGKEREAMQCQCHQQVNHEKECGNNKNDDTHHNNNENAQISADDEDESNVKLAKLSELKDMSMSGGGSSSWLQVGIGSTTTTNHHDEGSSK